MNTFAIAQSFIFVMKTSEKVFYTKILATARES
jgi:hypothetical protein